MAGMFEELAKRDFSLEVMAKLFEVVQDGLTVDSENAVRMLNKFLKQPALVEKAG